VGQDHVLLVADAQFAVAVAFGEIGEHAHLFVAVASPGVPPIGFSEMVTMA
jgi:hypothetical protein